jgi:hypothetical protein
MLQPPANGLKSRVVPPRTGVAVVLVSTARQGVASGVYSRGGALCATAESEHAAMAEPREMYRGRVIAGISRARVHGCQVCLILTRKVQRCKAETWPERLSNQRYLRGPRGMARQISTTDQVVPS